MYKSPENPLVSEIYNNSGINNGRVVLHADLNNFFASVECSNSGDMSLWKKPVAVCGDSKSRHGIILAKNEVAKKYGIKTAETINEAKKKCPKLILLPAHYELYMRYANAARQIYLRYTDRVEPFGMDEAWLELTGCRGVYGIDDGRRIADEIRKTVKEELGITVSVGVSDNKVFAKLGSDYKKPDATTVFSPSEYPVIRELPVSEILYAGKSTCAKLKSFGITKIGELAKKDPCFVKGILGKNGIMLQSFCRGEDTSKVAFFGESPEAKSVGNSTTPPKDITGFFDAKLILSSLCDIVCTRLREENLKCRAIRMHFRDTELHSFERQVQLGFSTSSSKDLLAFSCRLLAQSVDLSKTPLRSIGVCAIQLCPAKGEAQMSLFEENDGKKDVIDKTVDSVRRRFGVEKISNALSLCDKEGISHLSRGYEVFTNLR
ncbi:MAG: DNA polymerase IV [Ruminococcaceae bacterium]|nr:DNA polymerase IV [Oscillospiraceae bacterium]